MGVANLRIVNKTGLTRDTEIYVGVEKLVGVTDIRIHHIQAKAQVLTATVTCFVQDVDVEVEGHLIKTKKGGGANEKSIEKVNNDS